MSETIQRGEHFYFQQPDGSWLRYNSAASAWESSAPPPPPPPPGMGAPVAADPAAAGLYEGSVYRGSGAVEAAREVEGSAAPGYEWRTVATRPVEGFTGSPLGARPSGLSVSRSPLLAIVVLAVLAATAWFGYRMFFGPETFSGEGVSFQYPNGWTQEDAPTGIGTAFGLEWFVGLSPDEDPPRMGIIAGRFGAGFGGAVPDITRLQAQMRTNLTRLTRGTGMTIGRIRTARLGQHDSVTTSVTVPTTGAGGTLRLFFVPDSSQGKLYMMGCIIGDSARAEARDACKLMTDSFALEG